MEKTKERKLTAAEQRRKEKFEARAAEMAQQGYTRRDITVSITAGNILGIVIMLPFVAIFGWLIGEYVDLDTTGAISPFSAALLLPLLIVLIVVHELIHGFVWGLFAKNRFHSIEFGVIWKALTPYCTCSDVLTRNQYITGSAMPTVILGFLLSIVAIALNSPVLGIGALLMILSGGGDFLIIAKLLLYRADGKEVRFIDHPYQLGLVAFEREKAE